MRSHSARAAGEGRARGSESDSGIDAADEAQAAPARAMRAARARQDMGLAPIVAYSAGEASLTNR